jgi:hypothetical protein
MRDNHDGMPELIQAFEKDGHYFLIIELDREPQRKRYQFGVSRKSYLTLRRILQARTFDMMPGLKYRYFYAGSSHPLDFSSASMFVRIELGRDATTKEFEIPKELHANLLWFNQLESMEDAQYLEIDPS